MSAFSRDYEFEEKMKDYNRKLEEADNDNVVWRSINLHRIKQLANCLREYLSQKDDILKCTRIAITEVKIKLIDPINRMENQVNGYNSELNGLYRDKNKLLNDFRERVQILRKDEVSSLLMTNPTFPLTGIFGKPRKEDSIFEIISQFNFIALQLQSKIEEKKQTVESLQEEFKLREKNINIAIKDISNRIQTLQENILIEKEKQKQTEELQISHIESESIKQIEKITTPKEKKMIEEYNALITEWNNGKGERCQKCNMILRLSYDGRVDCHENYHEMSSTWNCNPRRYLSRSFLIG